MDYVRKLRRQSKKIFLSGEEQDFNIPEQEQVDDEIIRQADLSAIRSALGKVKDSERELLEMKYFDLMTDAEIAQKLHISRNSVRFYLTKVRRSLRRILEGEKFI